METDLGKRDVRITFSSYDFLGYFIPGVTFITISLISEYFFKYFFLPSDKSILPLYILIEKIKGYFLTPESHWSIEIIILVLIIILSYSIGHLIGSISSFTLDRLFVGKVLKYPYIILLKIKSNVEISISDKFRKSLVLISFLFHFILILSLFLKQMVLIYILIILIFILLLLMFYNYLVNNKKPILRNIFYYLEKSYSFEIPLIKLSFNNLINFIRTISVNFLGIYKPFTDKFIAKFNYAYKRVFKSTPAEDGNLVYWFTRNYIIDKKPNFNSILEYWFNLYSFTRNLSTSLFLSYMYSIVIIQINLNSESRLINEFFSLNYGANAYKFFVLLILFASFGMLLRYYYLFYSHFSKYLYRTFYYIVSQENKKRKK